MRGASFGPPTHRLLRRAVAAGVAAYVPQTADVAEVAAAIRACLSGGGSFSSHTLNARCGTARRPA